MRTPVYEPLSKYKPVFGSISSELDTAQTRRLDWAVLGSCLKAAVGLTETPYYEVKEGFRQLGYGIAQSP